MSGWVLCCLGYRLVALVIPGTTGGVQVAVNSPGSEQICFLLCCTGKLVAPRRVPQLPLIHPLYPIQNVESTNLLRAHLPRRASSERTESAAAQRCSDEWDSLKETMKGLKSERRIRLHLFFKTGGADERELMLSAFSIEM